MSAETKLKPGQKHPTPTPGNGDRVFYETLLAQNPSSQMAQEWCLAYGVMDEDEAKKAFKAVTKRKEKERAKSKSPPPKNLNDSGTKRKSSSSGKKKKKSKNVLDEVVVDAGMNAGGAEGIGVSVL